MRTACPAFASCAIASFARYLGVDIGPGAWDKQWGGVASKLLQRTGEIVSAGEALGTRLIQYRIYCVSLALYRAQFAALDWRITEAHRQAVQRLCAAPWMAFPPPLLEGLRSLGFASQAQGLHALADAARIRSVTASGVFGRCLDEISIYTNSDEALLAHPLHFWMSSTIMHSSEALRVRHRGEPRADDVVLVAARVAAADAAQRVLLRRMARWVEEGNVERVTAAVCFGAQTPLTPSSTLFCARLSTDGARHVVFKKSPVGAPSAAAIPEATRWSIICCARRYTALHFDIYGLTWLR